MNKKSNAAESKCESVKGKPDVPPGARVYMRSDEEMAVLEGCRRSIQEAEKRIQQIYG